MSSTPATRSLHRDLLAVAALIAVLCAVPGRVAGEEVSEAGDAESDGDEGDLDDATHDDSEHGDPEDGAFDDAGDEGGLETTVRRTRERSGFSSEAEDVERVPASAWRRRGAHTLGDALAASSAISVVGVSSSVAGLQVDGLPATQVTVLRDGLPTSRMINTRNGPAVDAAGVAVSGNALSHIEVSRGGASADANGAVTIDLVSQEVGESGRGWADSTLGVGEASLIEQSYELGLSQPFGRRFSLNADGGFRTTDAVDVNLDAIFDRPSRSLGQGSFTFAWMPSDNEYLRTGLDIAAQDLEVVGNPDTPLLDRTSTLDVSARNTGRFWLSRDLELRHALQYQHFAHLFEKEVRSSGIRRTLADTRLDTVRARGEATWFLMAHDVGLDLGVDVARIERSGESGTVDPEIETSLSLGLEETWYASDTATFEASAVGRYDSAFGVGGSASLAVALGFSDAVTLRIGTSYAQRVPTPEERFLFFDHSEVGYQVQGNEDLDPERVASVFAGGRLTLFDDVLSVDARVFYHHLFDAIDTELVTGQTATSPALFTYRNVGEAHTAGTNLGVRLEGLPGGLDASAGWVFLPIAEEIDGTPLRLRARHTVTGELRGSWLRDRLEAWVDVGARTALTVDSTEPGAPGYLDLGAGVGGVPFEGVHLAVRGRNLLDQTNATWGPVPGLTVLTTLTVDAGWGAADSDTLD